MSSRTVPAWRRARLLGCALLAATTIAAIAPTTSLGAGWAPQASGTSTHLYDVSCSSTSHCVAVGAAGTIRKTTNGGATWSASSSGSLATLSGVACPAASACYAVGWNGTVLKSADGGSTWTNQTVAASEFYYDISCVSASSCVISGSPDKIRTTTNGGMTWTLRASGTTGAELTGVSCPVASTCYIVTNPSGQALKSTDGGATWSAQVISSSALNSVACSDASTCTAVGQSGTVRRTTDGTTWTAQSAGTSTFVFDVICLSSSICFASDGLVAPSQSKIYSTSNGGSTWSSTASGTTNDLEGFACPAVTTCFLAGGGGTILTYDAVPPAPPTITSKPSNPSDSRNASFSFVGESGGRYECQLDGGGWGACSSPQSYSGLADGSHTFCVRQIDGADNVGSPQCYSWTVDTAGSNACASPSSTVVDGYAGGSYLRLRVERRSDRTVVCFRGQDGALPYLGGNVTITDPGAGLATPTVDDRSDDCSTAPDNLAPGPHPLLEGDVGPDNTHVKVDTYATDGAAWVCVQVGSDRARVVVPVSGTSAPTITHDLDSPKSAPSADTGATGYPSSTCQADGGESTRVANVDLSGGHLSLYAVRLADTHAKVCVRIDGPVGLGGALEIGGTDLLGSLPLPQVSDGACPSGGVNVVSLESPTHVKVRAYPSGSSASVCIEALSDADPNRVRKVVSVDPSTEPGPLPVRFLPDPGTPIPGI
ncbi:MAG TPA: YCF48-related protein [Solirubrobacteraceae bacterium]|nr:YCF48-related protein [Solirubrobacteraceae bacterium]